MRKEHDGKSLNASDESNLKRVQDCISSEFSAVFQTTKDKIVDRIMHPLDTDLITL